MSEKRRALGRGLGALIPSSGPSDDRPVDVFFQGGEAVGPVEGVLEHAPAPSDAPSPQVKAHLGMARANSLQDVPEAFKQILDKDRQKGA